MHTWNVCFNVSQCVPKIQHLCNEICLLWKTIFKHAASTYSKGTQMFPKNFASSEKQLNTTHFLNRDCFDQLSIFFKRKMHILQSHATFVEGMVFYLKWNCLCLMHAMYLGLFFATRSFLQEVWYFIRWVCAHFLNFLLNVYM